MGAEVTAELYCSRGGEIDLWTRSSPALSSSRSADHVYTDEQRANGLLLYFEAACKRNPQAYVEYMKRKIISYVGVNHVAADPPQKCAEMNDSTRLIGKNPAGPIRDQAHLVYLIRLIGERNDQIEWQT